MPRIGRPRVLIVLIVLLSFLLLACLDTTATSEPQSREGEASQTTAVEVVTYTVQAGDTLAKIAAKHGVELEEMIEGNAIDNPDVIEVGQILTIPVSSAQVTTVAPTTRPTPWIVVTDEEEQIQIPGTVYVDGRDLEASPPCTLMRINIWDGVPRTKTICNLVHGDKVRVVNAVLYDQEGRYYFEIQGPGGCSGWVSEPFLSTEFQNLVGDAVY